MGVYFSVRLYLFEREKKKGNCCEGELRSKFSETFLLTPSSSFHLPRLPPFFSPSPKSLRPILLSVLKQTFTSQEQEG